MGRSQTSPKIQPLDLLGRQRQLRSAVKVAARIALDFSRGMRRALPFLVKQRGRVTPGEVAVGAALSGIELQGPAYSVRLDADDGSAWALLLLETSAIMMILEGCLGGASPEAESVEALSAELSVAQRALLRGVTEKLTDELCRSIAAVGGLSLSGGHGTAHRGGESPALPDDAMRVDIEFSELSTPGTIRLFLGAEGLEAKSRDRDEPEPATSDPRMAEAIRDVELPVVVELGRITLGLGQVLALRPGETLRLGTALDDAVQVRVQGTCKFTGVPVISRGQVSVQIHGRHSE